MQLKTQRKTKTKRTSVSKYMERQWDSMVILPMFWVFVFSYLPMVGVIIAFKDYNYADGIFGSKWVGLENFRIFVTSNEFAKITWNTLYMNFFFIFVGIFMAVLVAILLYEVKSRKATKVYQTVMLTPHFLSWVIAAYMAYAILRPNGGYLNTILAKFGIEGVDWYSKPEAWPVILLICNVWKHIGMDSIMYYAALMGIDSSIFEAAEVDGANKFQRTIYIVIPELMSIITILSILKIGNIFRADFGLFYQVPRNVGLLYSTTDVIDTYIFRTMRVLGDFGLSGAVSFLQSIVGMTVVLFTNWVAKKIDPSRGLF